MRLLSKLFGRKKDDEFLSIVYLLKRPRRVDEPKVRAALAGLVQSVFKMGQPPATQIKALNERAAGLVIEGQLFVVMAVAEPYTTADPAEITPDLRKQRILKEHQAWIACDWMLPVANDDDRQLAYRTMGMVMATVGMLVTDDVIGLFDKGSGRLVSYSENVPVRLIGDFPESVFDEQDAPVFSSNGLEDELRKAADEAQSRLPEFVSAFERRAKGNVFGVKARFEEGDAVEWMWIKIDHITDDGFEGRLDNNPAELKRVKAGDRVTVKADEVVDWVIKAGDEMRGGFSIEVFRKHKT